MAGIGGCANPFKQKKKMKIKRCKVFILNRFYVYKAKSQIWISQTKCTLILRIDPRKLPPGKFYFKIRFFCWISSNTSSDLVFMDIQLDDWISFEIFDSVKYKSRFFIKVGMRYQSVPVEEICCFFVEERNSFIRTQRGKTYDLDFSLDQVQKMIDPALFFRINLNCISEILTYSTNRLKLKLNHYDNDDLIVSRNKVSEFKSWMDR